MIARSLAVAMWLAGAPFVASAGEARSMAHAIETAACRDWHAHVVAHLERTSASRLIDIDTEQALLIELATLRGRCMGPQHLKTIRRYALIEALLDELESPQD